MCPIFRGTWGNIAGHQATKGYIMKTVYDFLDGSNILTFNVEA